VRLRAGVHCRQDDGEYKLMAAFEWDGEGDVKIIHDEMGMAAQLNVWGLESFGREYHLSDGELFMRNVPWAYNCSTGYGDVWEEKDGKWVPAKSAPIPGESDSDSGETNV